MILAVKIKKFPVTSNVYFSSSFKNLFSKIPKVFSTNKVKLFYSTFDLKPSNRKLF
jgi:hypothetical protein